MKTANEWDMVGVSERGGSAPTSDSSWRRGGGQTTAGHRHDAGGPPRVYAPVVGRLCFLRGLLLLGRGLLGRGLLRRRLLGRGLLRGLLRGLRHHSTPPNMDVGHYAPR